jgi:hypothetical protein
MGINQDKPKAVEEIVRECEWCIYDEPPVGHPKNKDFMECDRQKIIDALRTERSRAEEKWSDGYKKGIQDAIKAIG